MAISRRSILNSFQRPVAAVVVLGLLVLVTVGVKARVWRNSLRAATSQQGLLTTARGPAEMVHFTIYDAGIFPREERVSPGVVALHLEDMSGGSAGLVVASESLVTLAQIVRRPGRWRDNAQVSLVPGRYTVYDASRPRNRATLIVEP
jgi:hypothetical protein